MTYAGVGGHQRRVFDDGEQGGCRGLRQATALRDRKVNGILSVGPTWSFDKSFFRKELYLPDSGDLLEWDEMLLLDYYRANRRVLIKDYIYI